MRKIERVEFNWSTAKGSPERIAWLKANHDKPITADEYVAHIKSLPHNHLYAAACRRPKQAIRDYEYLKQRFGFFGGTK